MKQIVSNYSYSPTANCVTLTGLNIDQDQLLLIVAPGVGRTLYNFASVTGSVIAGTNTRINLTASTAGLTTTSPLVIYYDDQAAAQSVTGTVALDPASLIALENITVTVGSSVSISNLPATQTIAGTVTANLSYAGNQLQWIKLVSVYGTYYCERIGERVWRGGQPENSIITIERSNQDRWEASGGLLQVGQPYIGDYDSREPNAGIWYNENFDAYITISYEQPSIQQVTLQNTVTIGSLPAISGTVTANVANSVTIGSLPAISGTVTASVTNSVTVGSLPVQLSTTTIGGTARLNVTLSSATTVGNTAPSYANLYGGSDGTNLRAILTDTSGRTVVTVSNFPSTQPVSLASLPSLPAGTAQIGSVTASISGTVPVSGTFWQATQPVSGTVTAAIASTTVTVSAMPSGTLTTRFGTPTTANTAFLTSAVTNTARKYLLIQNVTTASNVITVGVGFVPTTTQGIQLAAGAGITFESSYIPTGAVWVLSSVTASNHTILEA